MKKILVVDDNDLNRKLVKVALQSNGYEVFEAVNGEDAVNMALQNSPDLVFMDIDMPIVDGVKALKDIKKHSNLKNVPVVALTAYAMRGDKERFLDEGFDDYIPKPVSVDVLPAKIEQLCKD